MADDLERHYERAGEYWGVDPSLLRAVHMVEDPGGDPDAKSRAGAVGHMQIMPATAQSLSINPHDPVQSIYGGARVLRENLDRYGNVPDALRAYNSGTDRTKWGNPETMAYPQKVAAQYVGLQQSDDPFAGPGIASPEEKKATNNRNAFDSMFGKSGDAKEQKPFGSSDPFNSVFGHEFDTSLPQRAHAHQGSWVGNLARFGADAVDAAGRELSKPIIFAESHIPGVAKALKGTGYAPDEWRDLNNFREQEQAGDWGAGVSRLGGALLGDSIVAGGVGKLLPRVTGGRMAQAGRQAAEYAATAELTDQNPLLAGMLGAGSSVIGPLAYRVGGKLVRRSENSLNPEGRFTGSQPEQKIVGDVAPEGTPLTSAEDVNVASEPSLASTSEAPSAAGGQAPPESIRLGLFASPKDADKLSSRIWQDYQQGGPTALIESKIPGVHLTASQATGNAGLAQLERVRRAANPSPFTALEQDNAQARNDYAQKVIGTEDQLQAAEAARSAVEAAHREEAFGNQQPVDVTPIREHLARLIDDNRGRETVQTPLIGVLKQVNAVTKGDGTALPEHLWNVRKYMGDIISPAARGTTQSGHAAASQLMDLKPTITDTIEQGAPGFQNYAKAYEELSRPIDAMRFLQSRNLTDAQGNVRLGQLDTLLKTIKREKGKPGMREADSVTDEQIQALTDLRDDMRLASRIDLGKARGSDTNINLTTTGRIAGMAQGYAPKIAAGAAGALEGGALGGLLASAASKAVENRLMGRIANTQAKTYDALDNRLLNPYPKK